MSRPSNETVLRRLFWKLFLRGRSLSRRRGGEGKVRDFTGMMALQLTSYVVFGLMICAAVPASDTMAFAVLLHGVTLFLVVFQLVMTAGTVLFNKEEAEILLHRPVLPRELLRAKVTVMCAYSAILAAALNLPGMIAGLWLRDAQWWFPLAHLCSMLLLVVFCAGALVVVYQACLRWLGRERLDGMMATMQTVLTVMLVLASQSFRFMSRFHMDRLLHSWWLLVMPPMWFAALDALLASAQFQPSLIAPAFAGVAATALVAWLGFTRLAGTYGEGLMLLNETSGVPRKTGGGRCLRRLLAVPPLSWWVGDPVERSAFLLAGAYFFRDREMKLRLYPSMAQIVVMPFFFIFAVPGGWGVAFAATYMGWLPMMAMDIIECSEQWRASGIFQFTPRGKWQLLFNGVRKAAIALFAVPALVLLAAAEFFFKHAASQCLLVLPSLLAIPVWSLVPGVANPWLPLSKAFDSRAQSFRGCIMMPIVFAVSAALATAAWYCMRSGWYAWFLLGETLLAAAIFAILSSIIARSGEWEDS